MARSLRRARAGRASQRRARWRARQRRRAAASLLIKYGTIRQRSVLALGCSCWSLAVQVGLFAQPDTGVAVLLVEVVG